MADGYRSNNGAETNRETGKKGRSPANPCCEQTVSKNMLHRKQKNIHFTCHDKILEPQIIINGKSERVSSENNLLIILWSLLPTVVTL
jgi:hypothetical protein